MSNNDLQQLLSQLSAQTGKAMPSASEVESFLNTPGSQYLIDSLLSGQSSALSQAAAQARSGNLSGATDLIGSYLNTPEGQKMLARLRNNGGTHG